MSDSAESRIAKGRTIERWIQDPVIIEAFERADQMLFEQWKGCGNVEQREQLWAASRGLVAFQLMLQEMVNDGAIAQKALERGQ